MHLQFCATRPAVPSVYCYGSTPMDAHVMQLLVVLSSVTCEDSEVQMFVGADQNGVV